MNYVLNILKIKMNDKKIELEAIEDLIDSYPNANDLKENYRKVVDEFIQLNNAIKSLENDRLERKHISRTLEQTMIDMKWMSGNINYCEKEGLLTAAFAFLEDYFKGR